MEVPFAKPYLGGGEAEAVAEVIASGWLTQGPRVQEFERAFAARVGAAEAVATTNCTTALQLSLYVSGIGPGDEVIVPSLSFIATANAVWQCGATPVFADIACFSLHPRKVITCGEGGMITLQDGETAERLRRLRQHAMDKSALARHAADKVIVEHYPERGWNSRMTDLQAAVGLKQLEVLEQILAERRRLAARYDELLAPLATLRTPTEPAYARRTWQSYAVRVLPGSALDAAALMDALLADGVATRRGIMAIHLEESYRGAAGAGTLPHTEAAANETVLLPLFPGLADEQQDFVADRLGALTGALVQT
jgi:dTDP-4-amino-4,6-dideoxygalactose transaminase